MPFDSKDFVAAPVRHPEEIAILDKMAELLAAPERWCQGDFTSKDGKSLCVIGAVHVAGEYKAGSLISVKTPAYRAYVRLARELGRRSLPDFNDDPKTTHTDILALIARARSSFE